MFLDNIVGWLDAAQATNVHNQWSFASLLSLPWKVSCSVLFPLDWPRLNCTQQFHWDCQAFFATFWHFLRLFVLNPLVHSFTTLLWCTQLSNHQSLECGNLIFYHILMSLEAFHSGPTCSFIDHVAMVHTDEQWFVFRVWQFVINVKVKKWKGEFLVGANEIDSVISQFPLGIKKCCHFPNLDCVIWSSPS